MAGAALLYAPWGLACDNEYALLAGVRREPFRLDIAAAIF
jgi:hypothetical protein